MLQYGLIFRRDIFFLTVLKYGIFASSKRETQVQGDRDRHKQVRRRRGHRVGHPWCWAKVFLERATEYTTG